MNGGWVLLGELRENGGWRFGEAGRTLGAVEVRWGDEGPIWPLGPGFDRAWTVFVRFFHCLDFNLKLLRYVEK